MEQKHSNDALFDKGFINVIHNLGLILVEIGDGSLRFDQYKRIKRMKGRTVKYIQRHQKKCTLIDLKIALHRLHRLNWISDELHLINHKVLSPVKSIIQDNLDNPHIYEKREKIKRSKASWVYGKRRGSL